MKHIWIKVSLILALSCSQEPTEEKQPEPVILTSSESICHCYDGAVSIYEALFIEEKLEYKKAYWKLRQECLTKYGILLFYDSECNDVLYLMMLNDSLYSLGIDLNIP